MVTIFGIFELLMKKGSRRVSILMIKERKKNTNDGNWIQEP